MMFNCFNCSSTKLNCSKTNLCSLDTEENLDHFIGVISTGDVSQWTAFFDLRQPRSTGLYSS